MKNLVMIILVMLGFNSSSQSGNYLGEMKKNVELLDSAKTTEQLLSVSSAFERIADAEKTEWLPYYYAALAQTRIGFSQDSNVDKDQLADKALELAEKAELLNKNAEIYAIYSMSATIKMLVDPQKRYMEFGPKATEAIKQGLSLDPDNPRLYYLLGSNIFNTPEFLNGGKEKAKPILEKALKLYKEEKQSGLAPKWGMIATEKLLERANN